MNPVNIVSFCENSLDKEAMSRFIQTHKAIDLLDPVYEGHLRNSNYQPVLEALWCERDRQKRFAWLKSKEAELHPVLMYELAIAEFTHNSTLETVISVALPLIETASFRVRQDAQCSQDGSVFNGDAHMRMSRTYLIRLDNKIQERLHVELRKIVEEHPEAIQLLNIKIREVALLTLTKELPSPNWIGWHGMSVFWMGQPNMHPEEKFKQLRDAYAYKVVEECNKALEEIKT